MSWVDSAVAGVDRVNVSDVRTVRAQLTGVPELRTPKGHDPISPDYARIEYSITRHEVLGVIVHGERPGSYASPSVRRRIKFEDLDSAPEWVRLLVKEHMP